MAPMSNTPRDTKTCHCGKVYPRPFSQSPGAFAKRQSCSQTCSAVLRGRKNREAACERETKV